MARTTRAPKAGHYGRRAGGARRLHGFRAGRLRRPESAFEKKTRRASNRIPSHKVPQGARISAMRLAVTGPAVLIGAIQDVDWLFAGRADRHNPSTPGVAAIGPVAAEVARDGKNTTSTRCHLSSARRSGRGLRQGGARPLVDRKSACIGRSTWPSTRTAAAPARTRKTRPSSGSRPSTY